LDTIIAGGGNTACNKNRQVMKDIKDTNDLIDTLKRRITN
jgi:hypothetical protein